MLYGKQTTRSNIRNKQKENILMSIKPEFAYKIFKGIKKFEYRKKVFNKTGVKVYVYASSPKKKIIGEFIVGNIICDTPEQLWERTKDGSGISEEFYFKYFKGKTKAYAIEVKNYILYDEPINPKDVIDNFVAPQSYMFINTLKLN